MSHSKSHSTSHTVSNSTHRAMHREKARCEHGHARLENNNTRKLNMREELTGSRVERGWFYILLVRLRWGFEHKSVWLALLLNQLLHCHFKEAHEIGRTKAVPVVNVQQKFLVLHVHVAQPVESATSPLHQCVAVKARRSLIYMETARTKNYTETDAPLQVNGDRLPFPVCTHTQTHAHHIHTYQLSPRFSCVCTHTHTHTHTHIYTPHTCKSIIP